ALQLRILRVGSRVGNRLRAQPPRKDACKFGIQVESVRKHLAHYGWVSAQLRKDLNQIGINRWPYGIRFNLGTTVCSEFCIRTIVTNGRSKLEHCAVEH